MKGFFAPSLDTQFSECVSKKYVNAYADGKLDEITFKDPYRFSFLDNFWNTDFYNHISNINPSLASNYVPGGEYNTEVFYEPFACEEFVSLVYGKIFRKFLASLVGQNNCTRPQNAYPQLRTIKSGESGLAIHSDVDAPYNGAAFFNLNNCWKFGDGGELVIWEQLDKLSYRKRFEFPPLGNSLSVMKFSQRSHHSVNKSQGVWARSNILLELQFSS